MENVLSLNAPPPPHISQVQPKSRTFNMTMKDAIQDVDFVASTLHVNSLEAKVLIDSRATKSFISREFVNKLQCEIHPLEQVLIIEVANQDRVTVTQFCPNCLI